MTTKAVRPRDDVLLDFASACPKPAVRDITRWAKRYPGHRDAIISLARTLAEASGDEAVLDAINDMNGPAATSTVETSPLDNVSFEDFRALKLKHHPDDPFPTGEGLFDILLWYGNTWPTLARFIDIDQAVIDLLNYGMLMEPIGQRFIDALSFAFETDPDLIIAGIAYDRANKRDRGAYVYENEPTVPKTYLEVVTDSDMSADRKAFWLEDAPFPRWARPVHRGSVTAGTTRPRHGR